MALTKRKTESAATSSSARRDHPPKRATSLSGGAFVAEALCDAAACAPRLPVPFFFFGSGSRGQHGPATIRTHTSDKTHAIKSTPAEMNAVSLVANMSAAEAAVRTR